MAGTKRLAPCLVKQLKNFHLFIHFAKLFISRSLFSNTACFQAELSDRNVRNAPLILIERSRSGISKPKSIRQQQKLVDNLKPNFSFSHLLEKLPTECLVQSKNYPQNVSFGRKTTHRMSHLVHGYRQNFSFAREIVTELLINRSKAKYQ